MFDSKICKKCQKTVLLKDFAPHAKGKFGRTSVCRACRRKPEDQKMPKKTEEQKKAENNARSAAWRKANPERATENVRRWRSENVEYKNQQDREYHKAHREENNIKRAQWNIDNPERYVAQHAKIRQGKRDAILKENGLTRQKYEEMLQAQGGRCFLCERTEPGAGLGFDFYVDQFPGTNTPRSLLCLIHQKEYGCQVENIDEVRYALSYNQPVQGPEIADTHKHCRSCNKAKSKKNFSKREASWDGLAAACKTCLLISAIIYRRERMKVDIGFKLRILLRGRLRAAIKNGQKAGSAIDDLGCSIEFFKEYIATKFYPNPQTGEEMTWDNWSYEGWHMDHIKPLALFDLTNREQFLKACHYTNLQPMWGKDNLLKAAKYDGDVDDYEDA